MVTIGIDPHKHSHTAVALHDGTAAVLDTVTVEACDSGHEDLLLWAQNFSSRTWAIEDVRHVSGRLERALVQEAEHVVRVPPKMTGQSRRGERTVGKSDPIDAAAVGRAAMREPDLAQATRPSSTRPLRLLTDRRDDLVAERTREVNRLRWLLHDLDPEFNVASRKYSYQPALDRARSHLCGLDLDAVSMKIAIDLLDRIQCLNERERAYAVEIRNLVKSEHASALEIVGCGPLIAAQLLGQIGEITRFATDAKLAMYAGVAPIPVSSGRTHRVRLNRRGNRQLNLAVHRIAVGQLARHQPAKDFIARKTAEGKTKTEAIRALKRHIIRHVHTVLSKAAATKALT